MNLSNEISSIKEVLRSSVRCPHCGTAISRVSGCNHMLCSNCRQSFCYGCGKAENHGHSRYQENLATKKNPTVLIEEVKKELEGELSRQHPCPNCRQPNPKMGNNSHMFCWACQVHYCAQCRRMVRKSSEHYGPRGRKQHSVDPEIPLRFKANKNDDSGS
uniref:RBR-type E3 ubiquitin transferase n=1 Tax=Oryza nivara TaxID=4536 RepID=A0A0E0H452_ORYNI